MDILNDPVALMSDLSWIPQAIIQKPEPADAASSGDAGDDSSAAGEGEEHEEGEEEGSMTLLGLAHVSGFDFNRYGLIRHHPKISVHRSLYHGLI